MPARSLNNIGTRQPLLLFVDRRKLWPKESVWRAIAAIILFIIGIVSFGIFESCVEALEQAALAGKLDSLEYDATMHVITACATLISGTFALIGAARLMWRRVVAKLTRTEEFILDETED